MGRAIKIADTIPDMGPLPDADVAAALSRHELADYACGLLGPLQQMAKQKQFHLLAHLVNMAYAEACWQRGQAKD